MEAILHQLIGSLSHYLQALIHPRWCRISAINSSIPKNNSIPICCVRCVCFFSSPCFVWLMGPLPNGHSWLINGGDPNHLLSGMILRVPQKKIFQTRGHVDCLEKMVSWKTRRLILRIDPTLGSKHTFCWKTLPEMKSANLCPGLNKS